MRISEDGRVYFTYSPGAVYKLTPPASPEFEYRIASAELDEDEEELYGIESGGKLLPTRFTHSQVEFLLNSLPCEQVSEGEQKEMPLLQEEVVLYYGARRRELNGINAEINRTLKQTNYFKNLSAISRLKKSLKLFEAESDGAKTAEIKKQLAELEGKQSKILTEKKVDESILHKKPVCELCGDTGFIEGKICACALAQSERIKNYAAAERKEEAK